MAQLSYFEHLLETSDWPLWWNEMPEYMRGAVENWMLAAYLIGVDQMRVAAGLK